MAPELDPEYVTASQPAWDIIGKFPRPALHDVAGRRAFWDALLPAPEPVAPEGLGLESFQVPSADGSQITVWRIWRKDPAPSGPTAAVLHVHAGGIILTAATNWLPKLYPLVAATGATFFSVDYRLAPEHRYPAAIEDVWAGLMHVETNAAKYNIDASRIGAMGESAGGGLVAALTIMARQRGKLGLIKRQILAYPMLDDRTTGELGGREGSIWGSEDHITAWTAYLGDKAFGDDVPDTAAPARVADVTGLPPLFIDVGQVDYFAKEDIKYAQRFVEAGIETQFHLYPGLPHGYDAYPTLPASIEYNAHRIAEVQKL